MGDASPESGVNHTPEQQHAFRIEAYRAAFDSKHHYDRLSWAIGGLTILLLGAALTVIPKLTAPTYGQTLLWRAAPAFLAFALLVVWHSMYHRNRFWAEVANEAARDMERHYGVRGPGLAFMKAHLARTVLFSNTDESGKSVAAPHSERCAEPSFHRRVSLVFWVASALLLVVTLLPPDPG